MTETENHEIQTRRPIYASSLRKRLEAPSQNPKSRMSRTSWCQNFNLHNCASAVLVSAASSLSLARLCSQQRAAIATVVHSLTHLPPLPHLNQRTCVVNSA